MTTPERAPRSSTIAWVLAYAVLAAATLTAALIPEESGFRSGVRVSGLGAAGVLIGYFFGEIRNRGAEFGMTTFSLGTVVVLVGLLYRLPNSGLTGNILIAVGVVLFFVELGYRSRAKRRQGSP